MDRLLALDLRDVEMEVLRWTKKNTKTPNPASGNRCETGHLSRNTLKPRRKGNQDVEQLSLVDHISTNTHSFFSTQVSIVHFEDNEAVIKMIIKGRSPTMKHVSRTHRVALDWLLDRINVDSKIQIQCVDNKEPTC